MEVQVPISVCGFSVYCNPLYLLPGVLGKVSRKGMPPSSLGCFYGETLYGGQWSLSIGAFCPEFPLGMILKTSSTYLFQSLTGIGNCGPNAIFSKYSIYMLATTGEQGEPIAAPCSYLKNLSWKVKTQFFQGPI